MVKKIFIALSLVAVLSCASFGDSAKPSFRGYSGLIRIPTADTLQKNQWNAGMVGEEIDDYAANDIFANYGFMDCFEAGLNVYKPADFEEDGNDDSKIWVNGKYKFYDDERVSVAAGVIDAADQTKVTTYIVCSKSFGEEYDFCGSAISALRLHAGIGSGDFDGLFAGLSGNLGKYAELMIEWDSKNWYGGTRINITDCIAIHAGFTDIGDGSKFGLGASYTKCF